MSVCLAVKVINADDLRKRLNTEADYLILRAFKRIVREARLGNGETRRFGKTRIVIGFAETRHAEVLAKEIDTILNSIPPARGLRIQSEAAVLTPVVAENWRATCLDDFGEAPGSDFLETDRRPISAATVCCAGKNYVLDELHPTLVFGRTFPATVCVPHPWVSREHAEITLSKGKILVTDRSRNGSYLHSKGSRSRTEYLYHDSRLITDDSTLSFGSPLTVVNGVTVEAKIAILAR